MKKLMTLMLGMALAFGSVAVTFAQDQPKQEEGKKKKGKKKKSEEPKKDLR
jgi:ribosomal protein L12E/L44/L45/RPP1/RPP2